MPSFFFYRHACIIMLMHHYYVKTIERSFQVKIHSFLLTKESYINHTVNFINIPIV